MARKYDDVVLAEEFIEGQELTCAILGHGSQAEALPLVEIRAPDANYDYHNKYFGEETKYLCPAPIDATLSETIRNLSVRAYNALGARGWGRIDIMLSRRRRALFARAEHLAGHDEPLAGADGGARHRYQLRRPCAAHSVASGARSKADAMSATTMNRWRQFLLCSPCWRSRCCAAPACTSAEVSAEARRCPRGPAARDGFVSAYRVGGPLARATTSRCGSTRRAGCSKPCRGLREASVRRVWPDRLIVTLIEHRALGVWEDGRLLSDRGELFVANPDEAEIYGQLPEFSGPVSVAKDAARRYYELSAQFAPLSLRVAAIDISDRKAWSLRLAPEQAKTRNSPTTFALSWDAIVAGAAARHERVAQLIAAYPLIVAKLGGAPARIDARYANGLAASQAHEP